MASWIEYKICAFDGKLSNSMSDQKSMDFLGQKRRVRPVRKVQVSTHFDELNFDEVKGPSTPEPPGLNATTASEVNFKSVATDNISDLQPRQAFFASKIPSPPHEMNTLVPEDFDLIDFLKPNDKGREEPIITDNTFIMADICKTVEETKPVKEPETPKIVGNEVEESKTEDVSEEFHMEGENHDSNTGDVVAATVVAVAATSVAVLLSEKNVETVPKEAVPVVAESTISEEPLKKVSEARKSIEASSLLANNSEMEKKTEVPKEAEPKAPETVVPNDVVSPIIIAKAPQTEKVKEEEKAPTKSELPKIAPIIIAEVPVPVPKQVVPEPVPPKVEEIKAPPPLPTNTDHLVAARESLKPSMTPVKPVNGAPTSEQPTVPKLSSSPLAKRETNSEELEKLYKELETQKLAFEREIDTKKALESQINAMISKSNAQEEALHYKNESMDQLHNDFLRINNDLTAVKTEKERLEASLAKAQEELKATSDTNAQAYLQKSDEVSELKDKVAEFASIIGQKNKEIDSLQRQLDEAKRANMKTALDNVQQYETIEDELLKIVEEEILRMQDTIDEQREYNSKMQVEVDSEYAYWKRRLSTKTENETK